MKYPTIDKIVLNSKQKIALKWLYEQIPKDQIDRSFMVGFFPKEKDFWKIEHNKVDKYYWILSDLCNQYFEIMTIQESHTEKVFNCPIIKEFENKFGILPKYIETLLESNGIELRKE